MRTEIIENHSEFSGWANSFNESVSNRSWWTMKLPMIPLLWKSSSAPVVPHWRGSGGDVLVMLDASVLRRPWRLRFRRATKQSQARQRRNTIVEQQVAVWQLAKPDRARRPAASDTYFGQNLLCAIARHRSNAGKRWSKRYIESETRTPVLEQLLAKEATLLR